MNRFYQTRNSQNSNINYRNTTNNRHNHDSSLQKSSSYQHNPDNPTQLAHHVLDIINSNPKGIKKYDLLIQLKKNFKFDWLNLPKLQELIDMLYEKILQMQDMVYPMISNQTLIRRSPSDDSSQDLDEVSENDDIIYSGSTASHINQDFFEPDKIRPNSDFLNLNFESTEVSLSDTINTRVKFRLEKLIQSYPEGVSPEQLLKLYQKEFNIDLEWTEYGFQRLSDFCANLPDIFRLEGPFPNGEFVIFDAKIPKDQIKIKRDYFKPTLAAIYNTYCDSDNDEAIPIPPSDSPLLNNDFKKPDDVASANETCGSIDVSQLFLRSDPGNPPLLYVTVCESFSPSFFFIQLKSKEEKFKQLMTDLGVDYQNIKPQYKAQKIYLEKGLQIACKYFGEWHRGVIKEVKPNDDVTVFFYDYGTLKTYSWTEIYYLKLKFTYLPAQAIACGLFNLVPYSGSEWSRDAKQEFVKLTNSVPLWASIASIDADKNSMLIGLTNTSTDYDVHIAERLKELILAKDGIVVRKLFPRNFLSELKLHSKKPKKSHDKLSKLYCSKNSSSVKLDQSYSPTKKSLDLKDKFSHKKLLFDDSTKSQILNTNNSEKEFKFYQENSNIASENESIHSKAKISFLVKQFSKTSKNESNYKFQDKLESSNSLDGFKTLTTKNWVALSVNQNFYFQNQNIPVFNDANITSEATWSDELDFETPQKVKKIKYATDFGDEIELPTFESETITKDHGKSEIGITLENKLSSRRNIFKKSEFSFDHVLLNGNTPKKTSTLVISPNCPYVSKATQTFLSYISQMKNQEISIEKLTTAAQTSFTSDSNDEILSSKFSVDQNSLNCMKNLSNVIKEREQNEISPGLKINSENNESLSSNLPNLLEEINSLSTNSINLPLSESNMKFESYSDDEVCTASKWDPCNRKKTNQTDLQKKPETPSHVAAKNSKQNKIQSSLLKPNTFTKKSKLFRIDESFKRFLDSSDISYSWENFPNLFDHLKTIEYQNNTIIPKEIENIIEKIGDHVENAKIPEDLIKMLEKYESAAENQCDSLDNSASSDGPVSFRNNFNNSEKPKIENEYQLKISNSDKSINDLDEEQNIFKFNPNNKEFGNLMKFGEAHDDEENFFNRKFDSNDLKVETHSKILIEEDFDKITGDSEIKPKTIDSQTISETLISGSNSINDKSNSKNGSQSSKIIEDFILNNNSNILKSEMIENNSTVNDKINVTDNSSNHVYLYRASNSKIEILKKILKETGQKEEKSTLDSDDFDNTLDNCSDIEEDLDLSDSSKLEKLRKKNGSTKKEISDDSILNINEISLKSDFDKTLQVQKLQANSVISNIIQNSECSKSINFLQNSETLNDSNAKDKNLNDISTESDSISEKEEFKGNVELNESDNDEKQLIPIIDVENEDMNESRVFCDLNLNSDESEFDYNIAENSELLQACFDSLINVQREFTRHQSNLFGSCESNLSFEESYIQSGKIREIREYEEEGGGRKGKKGRKESDISDSQESSLKSSADCDSEIDEKQSRRRKILQKRAKKSEKYEKHDNK